MKIHIDIASAFFY